MEPISHHEVCTFVLDIHLMIFRTQIGDGDGMVQVENDQINAWEEEMCFFANATVTATVNSSVPRLWNMQ